MTQNYAELELSADVDGDKTDETAIFTIAGNLDLSQAIRTGYLVGGQQSQVNSIIANWADPGQSKRQQFFVDLGAGARTWEVNWTSWEGAQDEDGNPLQWGNTGDPSQVTPGDATGASAVVQMEVFFQYLSVGTFSSDNLPVLRYGEHTPDGMYEPVEVVPESPTIRKQADDGSWVDGSMTLVSAASLKQAIDGTKQTPK